MAKKKVTGTKPANKKEERFYLDSDDDGHWYCVPVSKAERFNELLWPDDADEADDETFWQEFNQYSLGGSPNGVTFTDPQFD